MNKTLDEIIKMELTISESTELNSGTLMSVSECRRIVRAYSKALLEKAAENARVDSFCPEVDKESIINTTLD